MPTFISEIFESVNYCCCGGAIEYFSYSVDNTVVYIYIYIERERARERESERERERESER